MNCVPQTKSDMIHLLIPVAWFEVVSEAHNNDTDESAWAFGERTIAVVEPPFVC